LPIGAVDEPRALFDDYAGVDGIAGSPQGVEGVLGIDLVVLDAVAATTPTACYAASQPSAG
jgi:hypothetical protein